jgi:hypothetical protein
MTAMYKRGIQTITAGLTGLGRKQVFPIMMFRKNKRPHPGMLSSLRDTVASEKRDPVLDMDRSAPPARPVGEAFVRIEYDMMQKGSHVLRRGVETRQYLIMVNGSVRIVNSGDVVDRETYDALVAAGVLAPPRGPQRERIDDADPD